MSLDQFASIAEIVSAAGVILSLVFLVIELRKNTTATRQQSYHNIVTRRAALFYEGISQDRETMGIFAAGIAGGDFDELDSQRFLTSMTNLLSHWQDVYMQYQTGIVEANVWRAERKVLSALAGQPGFKNFWPEISQYFLAEFIDEVDRIEPVNPVVFDRERGSWGRPEAVYLSKQVRGNDS